MVIMIEEGNMTNKEIRQKLETAFEKVSLSKGVFTVKKSFFYTFGYSSDKMWDKVKTLFPDAILIENRDDWKNWPKISYFIVKFKLNLEKVVRRKNA
jgi:hypothetical protein